MISESNSGMTRATAARESAGAKRSRRAGGCPQAVSGPRLPASFRQADKNIFDTSCSGSFTSCINEKKITDGLRSVLSVITDDRPIVLPESEDRWGSISEDECLAHLERLRWPEGLICLRCRGQRIFRIEALGKSGKTRRIYRCGSCEYQFSSLVGTIFEGSHLPLVAWFTAIWMLGLDSDTPAKTLQHEFGISYETAWTLKKRVVAAWAEHAEFCRSIASGFGASRSISPPVVR